MGVIFASPKRNFNAHVVYLKNACNRRTNTLKTIGNRHFDCSRNTLRKVYITFSYKK